MFMIRNIIKRYDGRVVLDDVSFAAEDRKITYILGTSGSGKSTLLKTMIGAIKPDAGEVLFGNMDIAKLHETDLDPYRKKIGMLFQQGALINYLSVFDNIALPMREHTTLDENIIKIMVKMKLELVGLRDFEDLSPSQISGGMRKRVGLARAIALDPEIVFYDEPSAGLDPIATSVIDQLVIDLRNKLSVTSIVVTHDMKSALRIADRVAMLYNGEFIAVGPPEEFSRPTDPRVRQFVEGLADGPIPLRVSKTDYLTDLLGADSD